MKQQIEINEVNVKESQAGTEFASVRYNNGEVGTCWDKDIYSKLNTNTPYMVDIQKSKDGKFNNIRSLYEDEATTKETVEEVVKEDKFSGARVEKNKSFYTAYAKDIFCAMLQADPTKLDGNLSELMKKSVDLVKQAEGGF